MSRLRKISRTKPVDIGDPTRPLYPRPPGEVGICLDVYDAVPTNPREFATRQFFTMNLMEQLLERFDKIPLEDIKVAFERRELLDGVLMRKFHRGIILSVAVEDEAALQGLWSLYEGGRLGEMLNSVLITPEALKTLHAERIQLRTRMWADERDICRQELILGKVKCNPASTKAQCDLLISRVKMYQQKLQNKIADQQEKRSTFDNNLSEFLHILMRGAREILKRVDTNDDFHRCVARVSLISGNKPAPCVLAYRTFVEGCLLLLEDMQREVICRILLLPQGHESTKQRELKLEMRDVVRKALKCADPTYKIGHLKHAEWSGKMTAQESAMFLGLLSQLSSLDDSVSEVDQMLHEYMSGWPIQR